MQELEILAIDAKNQGGVKMPLPEEYCCNCCMFWTGERDIGEDTEGSCIRFPNGTEKKIDMTSLDSQGNPPVVYEGTIKTIKKASDTCGEWKNYLLPHGGIVKGTPEHP